MSPSAGSTVPKRANASARPSRLPIYSVTYNSYLLSREEQREGVVQCNFSNNTCTHMHVCVPVRVHVLVSLCVITYHLIIHLGHLTHTDETVIAIILLAAESVL